MKKQILTVALGVVIAASVASAAVSIQVGAADVRDNVGNLAPLNTVGLWIIDTATNGFVTGTLDPGFSIAVGSRWPSPTSDDYILAKLDINAVQEPGYISIDFWGVYPSPVAAGMRFGIVWMVNQTLADDIARPGWYGFFTDWQGVYGMRPWILPPDPTAFLDFDMTTESQGGTVPNEMGYAMHQIIPEPSTALLVGAGLLGLAAIRRRR